jgi:protocatechuate 3,4-dioxygenase beta subunit
VSEKEPDRDAKASSGVHLDATDDRQRGGVLTRREVFVLLGASGVMALARSVPASSWWSAAGHLSTPAPTGTCVVRPEQTEGPYFVDEMLERSDIRTDPFDGSVRPGVLLQLVFTVSNLAGSSCTPLQGAVVDIWHCDALGVYSDVLGTAGRKFLRGFQRTDASGVARFTTVYPGWYVGRTAHLHFKIRSAPIASPGFEFTSQLYFDDALTDTVFEQEPYSSRGERTTRNAADGIFAQGGSQLLLAALPDVEGYTASFDIALLDATPVQAESWSKVKERYESP